MGGGSSKQKGKQKKYKAGEESDGTGSAEV